MLWALKVPCGRPGAIWAPSWDHLGAVWDRLGALLARLRDLAGPSWGPPGAVLGRIGTILGSLCAILGCLGQHVKVIQNTMILNSFCLFGVVMEPCWGHFGPSRSVMDRLGRHVEPSWDPFKILWMRFGLL